jgi:predicted tellurium resistance membrane protein TerC
VLIIGLALSIALMGFAATFIARLLHKHRWIAYVGLVVILYVAIEMTLKGAYGQWPEQLSFLSAWFGAPGQMGH